MYPVATLSGSIIGVGFLSLPYIALRVGIWVMLLYFIVLTALVVFIHTIFGEISLKTPDLRRFPGFVEFHLGVFAKWLTLVLIIFGSFGVLLSYLIVGGGFLGAIFGPILGGSASIYIFIYFCAVSFIVYFGLKLISRIEFWALILLLLSLLLIFIKGFSHISFENIFSPALVGHDWKTLFLPYGAIMFSLWGIGLIPEIEEMLRGRKHLLKKVIIVGVLIPAVFYVLFTLLIMGISGSATTESALVGLKGFLDPWVVSLAIFIGVITTFTAFITQGLFLKDIFIYDMKMHAFPAWVFTCFVPLILFLIGINSFIGLISFIGGVFLGINGIIILLMYKKIGGKHYIIIPLIVVFVVGIIYEMVYFLK